MSTYNSESSLSSSIESILQQSFSNFEFLICDDGSNDSTKKILEYYSKKDQRLKVFENNSNIGLTKSLNRLIKFSKCNFIARQDADDISYENRLEIQFKFLKEKNLDVVVSRAMNMNNKKKLQKFSYYIPYKILVKYRNPFIHGTLLINKKILENIGLYNEEFFYAQDYKLFKTLIDHNIKIGKIKQPLYELNTVNNISSKFKSEQEIFSRKVRQS